MTTEKDEILEPYRKAWDSFLEAYSELLKERDGWKYMAEDLAKKEDINDKSSSDSIPGTEDRTGS